MLRFRRPVPDDASLTLAWRRRPEVSRYLFTDIDHDCEGQRRWLESVADPAAPATHWVITVDGDPAGMINISGFDGERTSWGYYIGEERYRHLGAMIPPYLYNYLFFRRAPGLRRIVAEVMSENEGVIRMHLLHGYRREGVYPGRLRKGGLWHDVEVFSLRREEWLARQGRFGHYLAEFEE